MPTWIVASAQSTSSPFIQIFSVSRMPQTSFGSDVMCGHSTTSTGRRPRQAYAARPGDERRHVAARSRRRSRATGCAQQRPVDEQPLDARQRERGDAAGLEAGRLGDLLGPRDARERGARRAGDLLGVGAPVARDHRDHRPAVADEDERLDDLAELAADRARRRLRGRRPVRELLDARFDAGVAQVRGDALDRLRPRARRHGEYGYRPLRKRDHAGVVEALAAGGSRRARAAARVSSESAISALPPRRVRETAMFAMLTPASPKQRADAADHAGHVVVAEEDHQRRELHLELEAERADEPVPVLAADRRARPRGLLAVERTSTRTRFVKSRAGAAALLDAPRSRARPRSAARSRS